MPFVTALQTLNQLASVLRLTYHPARNDSIVETKMVILNMVIVKTHEFFSTKKADDEEGANVIATKFLSRMTLNSVFRISDSLTHHALI